PILAPSIFDIGRRWLTVRDGPGCGVAHCTSAAGTASAADTMAPRCTPGYSPCIRNKASDVDCHGGGGDGPRYTKPGVVYRVTGRDRYGLDSDDNGRACERN
ncbi:MAG: hypothetical protein ACR2LP_00485, partial [Candidatus Limnocylindrales bacterium]